MERKLNFKQQLKEKFFFLLIIGVSIFLFMMIITFSWIGYDVKDQCLKAKREYQGNCTEALIQVLNNENKDFRTRNYAIWALGQIGDSRALPTLESYYTGIIPEKEPLDKVISQYELRKAVKLSRGGINITAFFWRWNLEK